MAALVERGGDQGQAEHNEQVHRVAQDQPQPPAEPVDGEQPVVHGRETDHHGDHDGPPEQRRQQRPGGVHRALGQQRAPRPEREQRVDLRRGCGGALVSDDAERQELSSDEIANLVGGQGPAQVGADQVRDDVRAAEAVDPVGHPALVIEQQ